MNGALSASPNQGALEAASRAEGRSLWADARRRLMRNRLAVTSMIVLAVIAIASIVGPWLSPHPMEETYWDYIATPPSLETGFWFGTDTVGRDLLVRTLHGGRISLAVGLIASLVSLVIGVLYGATAGFLGGKIDNVMMRFVDILYSIPYLFFVIILMVVFGRNFILLFVAIGAVEWLTMARIVRGQTISLREREFIEAATAMSVPTFTIIRRHIIPNLLGPVIVYLTLTIPGVILLESFLSFLGLGIQEPLTSWGVLISDGARDMETSPWMIIFPATFMAVTLFCLNFIGDGLRDALDPKER